MASDTLPETGFFEKHRDRIAFARPDECWLWNAGKFSTGYGRIKAHGVNWYTHRLAYEAENGEGSTNGLVVRHKCDVRACVNPAHLETGTKADNNRDRDERGRQAKGEASGNVKLTESQVLEMRAIYVFGSSEFSQRALARKFGVAYSLVGGIVRRKSWRHI